MSARTDLALESLKTFDSPSPGIKQEVRQKGVCTVTDITVENDEAGKPIGKSAGRYITVETRDLSELPNELGEEASVVADEIVSLCGGKISSALVIGLGNSDITPDALGPQVTSKILTTRHLHSETATNNPLRELASVSALAPGVLGQTGMEAAEIVKALCKQISPDVVLVVDALACSDISRLGKTVQLTDTGISPGSGVQNSRKELSFKTLGVKTIAIGVPTVVDMHTIIENCTGVPPHKGSPNMMVTPRSVDRIIEKTALILSLAINKALQPMLSVEEITALCL